MGATAITKTAFMHLMPVMLSKRPKHHLRRKNRIYFNIQFDLKNKEIMLANGLTSVQNKQEININRTKNNKLTS